MVEQELTAFSGYFEPSKTAARPAVGEGLNAGWARRISGREAEPEAATSGVLQPRLSHGNPSRLLLAHGLTFHLIDLERLGC
jgi:hypothetical protein